MTIIIEDSTVKDMKVAQNILVENYSVMANTINSILDSDFQNQMDVDTRTDLDTFIKKTAENEFGSMFSELISVDESKDK